MEVEVKNIKLTRLDEGKGKIGKIRKLEFNEEAMEALKKWLEVRGEVDIIVLICLGIRIMVKLNRFPYYI